MLQNKELLSLKQWHLKIHYADRTVCCIAFKRYILLYYITILIDNCSLKKGMNAKKTLTGPGLGLKVTTFSEQNGFNVSI